MQGVKRFFAYLLFYFPLIFSAQAQGFSWLYGGDARPIISEWKFSHTEYDGDADTIFSVSNSGIDTILIPRKCNHDFVEGPASRGGMYSSSGIACCVMHDSRGCPDKWGAKSIICKKCLRKEIWFEYLSYGPEPPKSEWEILEEAIQKRLGKKPEPSLGTWMTFPGKSVGDPDTIRFDNAPVWPIDSIKLSDGIDSTVESITINPVVHHEQINKLENRVTKLEKRLGKALRDLSKLKKLHSYCRIPTMQDTTAMSGYYLTVNPNSYGVYSYQPLPSGRPVTLKIK